MLSIAAFFGCEQTIDPFDTQGNNNNNNGNNNNNNNNNGNNSNGNNNEPTFVTTIVEGAYTIKLKEDGSLLELSGDKVSTRSTSSTTWKIFSADAGYYYIRPSGRLDNIDQNVSTSEVIMYSGHGGENQQWSFTSAGDGYFKIVNRANGRIIWSPSSHGNLMCIENPSDNMLFRFYKATTDRFNGGAYQTGNTTFGGSGFCTWQVNRFWIEFGFKINGTQVTNATLTNAAEEITIDGGCGAQGNVNETYVFESGSVSGSSVTVNFTPGPQDVKCNAVFQGTMQGNVISGTITWTRIDQGPPLNYVVILPISVIK
jgi:hypothetical protein